ncbi:MAG: TerB family tellurite resistance protein [Ekhidna sp.]
MNKEEKFRALIRMALIDHKLDKEEMMLLKELAKDHQMDDSILAQLMEEAQNSKEVKKPVAFNLDLAGKIEILADLVKIMKADGKVFFSEIKFCEMMARIFGFDAKSIEFLSDAVHKDKSVSPNWATIQTKMREYVA